MSDENKGPRGGDLTNEAFNPAWRTQSFAPLALPDGGPGLNRFVKDHDTAAFGVKNEQPWHRLAAFMIVAGRTNSEVAIAAGVSPYTVTNLRQQKWFQELCASIANVDGEEIMGAIKSYTLEAVEGIATIARESESDRVRLAAYTTLLEQAHGKPTQKVISHSRDTTYSSPEEEMRSIQDELNALSESKQPSPEIPAEAVK